MRNQDCSGIIERDIQAGTEMAWHGKTTLAEVVTKEIAFPYEIERQPIFSQSGEQIPGWSVFVCSDDGKIAGKPVADTYVAISNSRFWEMVINSVGGCGYTIESAGTLFDRSRRFVSVKLGTDGEEFKVGERAFKNRLSIVDSIDGSTRLYAVNTSTCIVCRNTSIVAMRDKSGAFNLTAKHTPSLVLKIEDMEKAIDAYIGSTAQFRAALVQAESVPVKPENAREAFAGFLGNERGEALSTRSLNTVGRLVSLYRGGAGNRGETLLDVYSAVTDFYTHEHSGGESKPGFRMKQFMASEYGSGARAKADFFGEIFTTDEDGSHTFNRGGFEAMVVRGRSILARTESVAVN